MKKAALPEVSFVIPLKDDPLIDRLFQSLHEQSCKNFEVVVVDSSTSDASVNTLQKWSENFPVTAVDAKCGRGTARNIGAKFAKADILAFVDADVILPSNFVEELTKMFKENRRLKAVGFPIYPARSVRIPNVVYRFLRFLDESSFRYGKPRIPTTCAAYHRSIFQSRFFLDIIGEDVLFSADITKYGEATFAKHIKVFEEPRRWDKSSEIPKSLWHYIPAFTTNILILSGLHNSLMPKQEIKK